MDGEHVDDVGLIGVPLLVAGFGWVWMTDRIKELNPIGSFLTSDNLRAFNFGTPAQHIDPAVWKTLWSHWNAAVMPWWALAAAVVGGLFFAGKYRWVVALGLFTFLGGQFLFINLYAIHNYYFYANAWGACLAVGAVAAALWDSGRRWYLAALPAVLLAGAVCAGEFALYRRDFYQVQTVYNEGGSGLTDVIKRLTTDKDVVVVHSPDWSAILAHRSGRRMLMIADSQMYHHPEAVERSIELLRDENVPLVIFRGESRVHIEWLLKRIRDFRLVSFPLFSWKDDAVVYARRDVYQSMRRILEQEHFDAVTVYKVNQAPDLKEPELIAGTPKGAEIETMDPLPLTGSLPYGVGFRYFDGKKLFFAHPPTELSFEIPAGATRVELGYRMEPTVYQQKDFDGASVILDIRELDGTVRTIFEDWLASDGSQKPRYVTAPLTGREKGTLVFRTLAGPANNLAYEWVLLEYLRIR
jgi:hypothetical protein